MAMSESQFYMWRAIFALAHADHVVTAEELDFMQGILQSESFTPDQKAVLEKDITEPQDITKMFMSIAEEEDRSHFFYFARMLCWSDGDFDEQEQKIMLTLKSVHVRNTDVDAMIGNVDMQLDDDHKAMLEEDMSNDSNPLGNFLKRFKSV